MTRVSDQQLSLEHDDKANLVQTLSTLYSKKELLAMIANKVNFIPIVLPVGESQQDAEKFSSEQVQ